MCSSTELYEFLSLGLTPPADAFLSKEKLDETEIYYPLAVKMCQECGLAQLSHTVSADILYCNHYPYDSSITESGRTHWNELAEACINNFHLDNNSFVIDIGSNVGVLLQSFISQKIKVLGIDPAPEISAIARERGVPTHTAFFSEDTAKEIKARYGTPDLITATNVFAHINDLDSFLKGIDLLLKSDGLLILEFPYFLELIRRLAYDTIYHEHLSYISIKPLKQFLNLRGFSIQSIEPKNIHGGSLRVTIGRTSNANRQIDAEAYIECENKWGLYEKSVLTRFAKQVEDNRTKLRSLIIELKNAGKKIAAVSAPAKGMTLLNYCNLGQDLLECVSEKTSLKIGRFTPGIHLPVISDQELLSLKPDYAILLAWNFKEEIMHNLAMIKQYGGKFIIPLPEPIII